jgi:hypothetical protein
MLIFMQTSFQCCTPRLKTRQPILKFIFARVRSYVGATKGTSIVSALKTTNSIMLRLGDWEEQLG